MTAMEATTVQNISKSTYTTTLFCNPSSHPTSSWPFAKAVKLQTKLTCLNNSQSFKLLKNSRTASLAAAQMLLLLLMTISTWSTLGIAELSAQQTVGRLLLI